MPTEKARRVMVTLYKDGQLKDVKDKEGPHFFFERGKYQKAGLPLDGEHYEWTLSEYEQTGIPITSLYRAYAHIAPNEKNSSKDKNTIARQPIKLIKLDCGLWAAYKIHREYEGKDGGPQRDFGLVENGHAWQAQYISALNYTIEEVAKTHEETKKELAKYDTPLVSRLAALVAEPKMGAIKLLKQTKADMPDAKDEKNKNDYQNSKKSLYICFPDLHLPEKWPDLPDESLRYIDYGSSETTSKVRRKLQELLRLCQSRPGLIFGSKLSKKTARNIQDHLELLSRKGLIKKWTEGNRDHHDMNVFQWDTGFSVKIKTGISSKQVRVTPNQFLAEKDIVDRALRVHCSWFYGPGNKYVEKGLHKKAPPFGKKDLSEVLLECNAGDERPAFDLVNLLVAIRQLRKEPDLDKNLVRVRQVGDLLELWQNREFLYHGLWVRQTDAGGEGARKVIRTAAVGFFSKIHDGYQYRKDRLFYDSEAPKAVMAEIGNHECHRRYAKWYSYNPIPKEEMFYRHVVGDMVKKEYLESKLQELETTFRLQPNEIERRRLLLKERMDSVENFSLPLNEEVAHKLAIQYNTKKTDYLALFYMDFLGKDLTRPYEKRYFVFSEDAAKGYTQKKRAIDRSQEYTEVYWNKLILELLKEVECKAVYGNHDGYRGDPMLNSKLDEKYRSPGWISDPGLWFEHGHRWDEYNRDGCAFGAGATNLGYYWWHNIGGRSEIGKFVRKQDPKASKQEQKCYQAGAAVWYLLVRSKENLLWLSKQTNMENVKPFGIYVCGHTHSADLVEIRFSLEKGGREEMTMTSTTDILGVLFKGKEGEDKKRVRVTAKRYAQEQKEEYGRHVDQSGKVNRLPWLKRPE